MFDSLRKWMLYRLLAKELKIHAGGSTPLGALPIKSYTHDVFNELEIYTVREAVFAYCLHYDTPGIGKGSWDDLFTQISE